MSFGVFVCSSDCLCISGSNVSVLAMLWGATVYTLGLSPCALKEQREFGKHESADG
jgi:hypothetical protein